MATLEKQKVVMIFSSWGGYYLFVEDFDNGKMQSFDTINMDFPYKTSDFTKKKHSVMLSGFGRLSFCVVDQMLYMFEGSVVGQDLGKARRAYVLPLMGHFSLLTHYVLCRDEARQIARTKGPKVEPVALRFGSNKIVVFSTNIHFLACGNDFEMYDVETDSYRSLAPLCVCYVHNSGATQYVLCDPSDGCTREAASSYPASSFKITTYIRGEDSLVVQTSFGLQFTLWLDRNEWVFSDGPWFDACPHVNFLSKNELLLTPFSCTRYYNAGGPSSFPYPLSSRVTPRYNDRRNFLVSLEEAIFPYHFPCILQLGFRKGQKPIWTVDVLRIDESVMPRDKDEDEYEYNDKDVIRQFVECIKSFKFASAGCDGHFTPEALFLL